MIFITASEHPKLVGFNNFELVIFAVIEMALGTCVILCIKEFVISYRNSTQNITETERTAKIINGNNFDYS